MDTYLTHTCARRLLVIRLTYGENLDVFQWITVFVNYEPS